MDMQFGEPTILGTIAQHIAGVGVPLNGADWIMAEDEIGEQSASGAGE